MPTTAYDLPTELWLSILRHVEPQFLFRIVRQIDRRSKSCADDIFRNEILPGFRISLHVFLESEYPLRPGGDVQLGFGFHQVAQRIDGIEIAQYTVTSADPEVRRKRAVDRWRDYPGPPYTPRVPVMLRVTLPPHFLVSMQGRVWRDCVAEDSGALTDEEDANRNIEMLQVDWKKFVATYFRKMSALEEIADRRKLSIGSQFPMY